MDRSLLAGFAIFADVDAAALDAIAAMCQVSEHAAGTEVFAQNADAQYIYGVLDGGMELVLTFSEDVVSTSIEYEEALSVRHEIREKSLVVETLEAGDVFGWSSMVEPPGRWSSTARCTSSTKVFTLPAAELKALFEAQPSVGYRFMCRLGGLVAQRLQHRTDKLVDAWGEAFDGEVI